MHELAELAGVTIGSLYHHFGSKLGLYDAVRTDIERRLLDRMEGAADVGAATPAVLLVGFDYLVRSGFARLLSEPHPDRTGDPVQAMISARGDHDGIPVARLLLAAWRAALGEAAGGRADGARAALVEVLG